MLVLAQTFVIKPIKTNKELKRYKEIKKQDFKCETQIERMCDRFIKVLQKMTVAIMLNALQEPLQDNSKKHQGTHYSCPTVFFSWMLF